MTELISRQMTGDQTDPPRACSEEIADKCRNLRAIANTAAATAGEHGEALGREAAALRAALGETVCGVLCHSIARSPRTISQA